MRHAAKVLIALGLFVLCVPLNADVKGDLRNPDPAVRMKACQDAGNQKLKDLVPDLLAALKDKSDGVRINAAVSLGQIGDPRAAAPLRDLAASDKNAAVRIMSAQALGNFRDTSSEDALLRLSDDKDPGVRGAAVRSIAKIGSRRGMSRVLGKAERDNDAQVRRISVEAVAENAGAGVDEGDRAAFERILSSAAAGGDIRLKGEAQRALGRMPRRPQGSRSR